MQNMQNNNYIALRSGIVKSYWLSDEFCETNNGLHNQLSDIFDRLYEGNCCVVGASRTHNGNADIKNELCNLLDAFFDLNVVIKNAFDGKRYKTKKAFREYILRYNEVS